LEPLAAAGLRMLSFGSPDRDTEHDVDNDADDIDNDIDSNDNDHKHSNVSHRGLYNIQLIQFIFPPGVFFGAAGFRPRSFAGSAAKGH